MSYGVEVKPKGKRKFKRLSVSKKIPDLFIKSDGKLHALQYCKDNNLDANGCEWRVVNRNTDSIVALGKPIVLH